MINGINMDDIKTETHYNSTFHTIISQPEVIGKYEIIEQVGKGSMGTVFQAHDPFSNKHVAIKVAHPQFINENEDGK